MAIIAKRYDSGFPSADDTFNSLSTTRDGKLYYILTSKQLDRGGQMYVFDPQTESIQWIGDLTELCGEELGKAIPQGKSHVRFFEADNKLYFATHTGYYQLIDGMFRMPVSAPEGYALYPGGHILSYDLNTGVSESLARIPNQEGVLSMTMDLQRRQIYAITWPSGQFIHYDVNNRSLKNLGKISHNGEAGAPGEDFRVLCRSLVVDPRTGWVYFSIADGDILGYHPDNDAITTLEGVNLRLDYFGQYDPTRPGSMGYNWRKICWHEKENVAYGVHGRSGYLFRFDPSQKKIDLVERITSQPSRRMGMFDQFGYGYLGFILGPDQETIYYLTGGPRLSVGKHLYDAAHKNKGAAHGLENLHLITFHLPSGTYTDHGYIVFDDGTVPTQVNSIAIGKDRRIYALARFGQEGQTCMDLISLPMPDQRKP